MVDSADRAAGAVIGHEKCYHLNDLHANNFHAAAVIHLGVQEMSFEDGTSNQSWYCHVAPRFGTHDEVT